MNMLAPGSALSVQLDRFLKTAHDMTDRLAAGDSPAQVAKDFAGQLRQMLQDCKEGLGKFAASPEASTLKAFELIASTGLNLAFGGAGAQGGQKLAQSLVSQLYSRTGSEQLMQRMLNGTL